MKVVVAHGPDNDVRELRKLLHGTGAHCAVEDCVAWEDLAARLGQSEFDLVVVQAAEAVDWASINQARSFTTAPLIAVGPNGGVEASARAAGISDYVQLNTLQSDLTDVVQRMMGGGEIRCQRGNVVAVVAPTPGNGGTFISVNFASQLALASGGPGAYIDMSAGRSKLALMLDAHPDNSLEDICNRVHRLDRTSLLRSFHKDESGLYLLYGSPDQPSEPYLNSEMVRKLTILSRMGAASTVIGVGHHLRQPQFDALRLADRVLVIVRPDVPSLNRAATTIDQLTTYGISKDRMVVAINFWGEPGLVSKQHIEDLLHWKDAHYLTYDPGRVNRCVNEGLLLQRRYPRCRLARELGKLAKLLIAKPK
jgi:Flp pilus assembly CpaE family ATPase